MKIKQMLLVMMAVAAAVAPSSGPAQEAGYGFPERLASWVSPAGGDMSCTAGVNPCYAEDCGNGNMCCHSIETWGSVELLMWWAKGTPVPPLVTTSLPGTLRTDAGVIGRPTTRILLGDELLGDEMQIGGRVAAGVWLDAEHNSSGGFRFFALEGDDIHYTNASTGDPILARPFFNAQLGIQDSLLIAYPGVAEGSIDVRFSNQNVLGAEAFVEFMLERDYCRRIDLILGYQFLRLDDFLQVNSNHLVVDPASIALGTRFDILDQFSAENEFHGAEVGLKGRFARGCWSLNALAKVGIGNLRQEVEIAGRTLTTPPGGSPTFSGRGFLAQPSNIGEREQNQFVFVPEVTLNLAYHVNRCLSLHVGYNILWLSDVALSGQHIDFAVNNAQPGGPARPQFVFQDDDYWLQGINFGLNWDF